MDEAMVRVLTGIKDEAWDRYGMQREPLLRKINNKKRIELAELAHSTGKQLAREVKDEYRNMLPSQIAKEHGIKVNRLELSDGGCYNIFASFQKPDKIDIYAGTIESAERALAQLNVKEALQNVPLEEVLIAHELFHYYENTRKVFPTNQKLVVLWELGKFKYKTYPVCLGEMAAMAFARELLNLNYSPYVLDILLLYPQNEEMAQGLFNYIIKINEGLKSNLMRG